MKRKVFIFVSILVVLITSTSCTEPRYPFSDSPYDDVYESTFYSDTGSWVMTSRTCPYVEENAIIITNYWWEEFDEEGNEEWLRYNNDFYRMIIPLSKASVEILYIPDKNNTAHIVIFGKL